jgi:streptogramin lyase
MLAFRPIVGLAAALLTACSSSLPFAPPLATAQATGTLVLRVRLPRAQTNPDYVSVATKGMTVDITGPTRVRRTVRLTANAKGCHSSLMTRECTLAIPHLALCPSKKNCYVGSVVTYDAYAGKKIPPGAHKLSAELKFPFRITAGNNLIPLVLYAIPTSAAFIPSADSSLTGSQSAGFVEPKCTASTQTVSIVGLDADGDYIAGAGAPKIALATSNSSQLAVAQTGPNAFTLAPPTAPNYAFGNYTVQLTARATPAVKSGAHAVSTVVNVTYSGDICGIFNEVSTPTINSNPQLITTGPDKALWFTEAGGNNIGRITTNGSITEYPLKTASSQPVGIATGADGNLWFTEGNASSIGRITTGGTVLGETPTPTAFAGPSYIVAGPDGNLWFTENPGNNVGRITTTAVITEFAIPTAGSSPFGIASGPNDALWFTECFSDKIASITTSGTIVEHSIPTANAEPIGIVASAGNTLWFAEYGANAIGAASSSGATTTHFPVTGGGSNPTEIIEGPDGAMWFEDAFGNRIGRVTASGTFTGYVIPTSGAGPKGMTVGPDGAIWFTECITSKIGRLR